LCLAPFWQQWIFDRPVLAGFAMRARNGKPPIPAALDRQRDPSATPVARLKKRETRSPPDIVSGALDHLCPDCEFLEAVRATAPSV
jgi:hypothetical protein